MQFTYTPEGADPRSWPFEPAKMLSPEAEAIERVTGLTFAQWQERVLEGSMLCTRALVWVLLKRTNPTLKFDQVVISMGEVDFEFGDEEKQQIRETLGPKAADGSITEDEAALLEAVGPGDDEAPLDTAPASSGDASTPSSSPT